MTDTPPVPAMLADDLDTVHPALAAAYDATTEEMWAGAGDCPAFDGVREARGRLLAAALEAAWPVIAGAARDQVLEQLGSDHYVTVTDDRWTIEHSAACRLSGRMSDCDYHAAVSRIAGDLDGLPGRWLITGISPGGELQLTRSGTAPPREPVPARYLATAARVTRHGAEFIIVPREFDVVTSMSVRAQVTAALDAGATAIVIDLDEKCLYMDTTGLGTVMSALRRVRAAGGRLAVLCTRDLLLRRFELTGLNKAVTICATAEDAAAGASSAARPAPSGQ